MSKKKEEQGPKSSLRVVEIVLAVIALVISIVVFVKTFNDFNNSGLKKANISKSKISSSSSQISNSSFTKKEATPSPVKKEVVQATLTQSSGNQLKVPMLMYHYIGNNPNPSDHQRDSLSTSPDKFEAQMQYLSQSGFTTISLDTLYASLRKQTTLPSKPIILTFDDGYVDFYYNAYPILRRFNFHGTEFIPTGLIGQGAYLTWGQIKEMSSSGFISFGAHTVHHYYLSALSNDVVNFEVKESKRVLEEQLGIPINSFAYPFGAVSDQVIRDVQAAGFIGAAGTWRGNIQSEGTIYNMPRIRISGAIDLETFKTFVQ